MQFLPVQPMRPPSADAQVAAPPPVDAMAAVGMFTRLLLSGDPAVPNDGSKTPESDLADPLARPELAVAPPPLHLPSAISLPPDNPTGEFETSQESIAPSVAVGSPRLPATSDPLDPTQPDKGSVDDPKAPFLSKPVESTVSTPTVPQADPPSPLPKQDAIQPPPMAEFRLSATDSRPPDRPDAPRAPDAGPGAARALAIQVVQPLTQATDGTVEVALEPEELGRVRLSLTPNDQGVAVQVQADRQDTLDLMRRHAAVLEREFREAGFGSVSFGFSSGGQNPAERNASAEPTRADSAQSDNSTDAAPRATQIVLSETRLDLRM
jgi:flagellar hook-length control protein FliK